MGVIATVAAAAVIATAASPAAAAERDASRSWAGIFDAVRPVLAVDVRRVIIRFDDVALATWAADHPNATPAAQRRFIAAATKRQDARLDAIRAAGIEFDLRHRYLRTFNGAAIVLHGDGMLRLAGLEGVADVEQVRAVHPELERVDGDTTAQQTPGAAPAAAAAAAPTPAAAPPRTVVAILDTGIDVNHPALAAHVAGPGVDVLAGSVRGVDPGESDGHGTQVAGGVVAGAGSTSVGFIPIRVVESQPVLGGREAVVGTSDDLLAGIEAAVDPDLDGAVDDHADIALIALGEPYGGFAGTPEEHAVAGAAALGTLTVASAGNDGESGDAVGTVSAPASSPAALAVGAADMRASTRTADVHARGGTLDSTIADAPLLTRGADVPAGRLQLVTITEAGDDVVHYLGADARSRVAGAAVLITRTAGVTVAEQVRAAADAGALAAIIADAGDPALAGVIDDERLGIPAIGVSADDARALRAEESVSVELAARDRDNPNAGTIAGFSSRGGRFDGIARPDVVSSGVGVATADVGRDGAGRERYTLVSGTSIAAAQVAGQAAAVRAAQPAWSPSVVRAALMGRAALLGDPGSRQPSVAQGAGVPDVRAAADATIVAAPARVDFGIVAPGATSQQALALAGVDGSVPAARWAVELSGPAGPVLSFAPDGIAVAVPADLSSGTYGGWLVDEASGVRVPWSVTVQGAADLVVPVTAALSQQKITPQMRPGAPAAELTIGVGGVATDGSLGLRALQRIEARLIDPRGRDAGVVAQLGYLLPGSYTLGVAGTRPDGTPLTAGTWKLALRHVGAATPAGTWQAGPTVTFTVE